MGQATIGQVGKNCQRTEVFYKKLNTSLSFLSSFVVQKFIDE
jgi:hypothetical protein